MELGDSLFWQRIEEEERKRQAEYKRGWNYYNGEHPKPLRVKPGQADDNIIVNLAQLVIDKGVSFLFGKEIEFHPDNAQASEQDSEEDFIDQTWEANGKMSFLQNVGVNGGVTGHCFIKLVPDGVAVDGKMYTRFVSLDPAIIRPFWDADDINKVLWYKIEYEALTRDGQAMKKQLIERAENGQSWTITNYISKRGGRYEQVGDVEIWDYPFAPIVDWQNLPAPNTYFGTSDLDSIPALNDGINFVASNILRIIRYHAHPKTWGKGFKASAVEIGADEMVTVPTSDALIANLEMTSDLASSRQYLADLTNWLLRIARVPNVDPATVNVGALSGFALKILYGDLLEKTETKRRTYGDAIREINNRVQAIAGQTPKKYKINWKSPLPDNKIELAQELDVEVNRLGTTSKETAADELERNWQVEQDRKAQEVLQNNNIGAALLGAFDKGGTVQ